MTTQTQPQNVKPANGAKPPQVATPPASASAPAKADGPTTDADKDDGDEVETKTRQSRKVYIVTGDIREFKNAAEAEKFLNSNNDAPKDFSVIKGLKVERKTKVSLR